MSSSSSLAPSAVLNKEQHEKTWEKFGTEQYDVVIIGGGSVGAGAALDAATRGLKTAVIETRDFAGGTSSRSSKMFHGGLRYLQMLDFRLVAESLRERELSMSHLAPHLVKPLRFVFPLTHRVWERPFMASGFFLYDVMGGAKQVPMQKHYSRKGTLKQAPGLKEDAVVGGVRYYDTLVDDARHTMTVLRTAAHFGADVRTSTQVVDFVKEGERIVGAKLLDTDTGATTTIRGSVFVNATGIWSDEIEKLAGVTGKFRVHTSKGVHIVIPKSALEGSVAMTFVTEKSVLFVIPWGEYWIIGTTDTDWTMNLANPAATRADIDYILDHVNAKVRRPITYDDIVGVYSGLRPLVEGDSDSTTNLSRNHAVAHVAPGMVSVAGGKYTTYRVIGADTIDAAVQDVPRKVPESVTADVPLLGADGYHALNNQKPALAKQFGITEKQVEHLLNRYGSLIYEVLAPAAEDKSLLEPLEAAEQYMRAEVLYAVTHEGAKHLDDILERRLRVSMEYAHRGVDSARATAELVAPALGWDKDTMEKEIKVFIERVEATLAAERELTDKAANEIAAHAVETRADVDVSLDR
ncbi:glycerol-3-phosphate dehydrogenase/oxidase [Corynebacterium sp. ACRPX]|uniref:glycerol-3-phosphate dehydrogenase/oxidase n=1 Tax=Corynebacterium TaxID=1716 RepID=UPI0008A21B31|nr:MULTISPECIES: glycerol-3-phosphate dehydrogenase/oxidase [Corynebacterium]MCG7245917.1 glycerol-3-phosphate dehydrogenase/oxidase [Corynebacterium sp. ACRPX]MDK8818811.1 glycerol-3-phosphate dehydrogenase/oxidase [Corynebacterium amycolatum]OFR93608.1 glycerol-3-phosphate dehydrogenase [Corynebacterium sp. HMSC064E10]PLA36262.1 glycerol-3-phosphate dehydrogenase/oxidase [Corynebacterium amycolatum]